MWATPKTSRPNGNRRFPFVEMPIIAALFELECLVSDKVSWSDTPAFHNTLVVGSSPTSSTTQLRATGEFLMAWRAFALEREGCGRSKWGVD